jgi:hypothetical protein
MSSGTFASSSSSASARSYASNVGLAARAFLAALLAVKPVAAASPRPISLRERAKARAKLLRMADEYETLCPNLSKELQFFASNC